MKRIITMLVVAIMALTMFGCNNSKPAETNNTGTTQTETTNTVPAGTLQSMISPDEEYVVVCCYNNIEFFNAHKYEWKKAGELFGVKTSWVGPTDGDTNAMVSTLESTIAKKPAGIAVWGYDPALKPSIDKAADAGIPIVTMIGDVEGSKRLSYIGSSQYDVGLTGGAKYAESKGGKGKVAILTLPGNPMFEERVQGFKDAFKNYPGIEVVAIGDTKADTVTAVNAAKDIIVQNPDVNAFVCADSTGAIGAVTAVKEMNKLGQIDIIGLDRNSDILQSIKNGEITGTIIQQDVGMAYWSMISLITAKHVNLALSSDNAAAKVTVFPENIFTPINYVDKSNVDYFLESNKLYAED